ncbi:MAG: PAS domain S-box protein, partial [Desulfobacterales bacterium]
AAVTGALGGFYGRLKETERHLLLNLSRYKAVVDDQADCICRFLPGGECTFANDAFCQLLGRPQPSVLWHAVFDFLEFDPALDWRGQIKQLSQERPRAEFEQHVKSVFGPDRWIHWTVTAIGDPTGIIVEYQALGRDVTDRKLADAERADYHLRLETEVEERTRSLHQAYEQLQEEFDQKMALGKALRSSEVKYRTLFESAPMGIAISTYEGEVLDANLALRTMIGLPAEDPVPFKALDFYRRKADREEVMARLQHDGTVRDAEVEMVGKDGASVFVSMNLTRFHLSGREMILAFLNDISIRRRALEKLEASEAELKRLSGELMKTQEAERKRIAEELHDSVGQMMHAMNYAIDTAAARLASGGGQGDFADTLEKLKPLVRNAAAETRRIVMGLRPPMLDDLGILATISWFCREFQKVYGRIAVLSEIGVEETDVPPRLRTFMFRILQEAFNNVAKHSGADRIRLRLTREPPALVLEIEDNGKGIEAGRLKHGTSAGVGLSSMRERARASGGTLAVVSEPDRGTRVRVEWPIDAAGAEGFEPSP